METVKFRVEEANFYDLIDELASMFEEHWEEVAKNKSVMVLKPFKEKYKVLQETGQLKTLIGYYGEEVVGYSVNILSPHLHYMDLVVAYNDIIFVKPEYRNSPLGLKLIRETEKFMTQSGAGLMLWHAKENTSLAKILPALRYGVQEICFSKILKKG